MAVAALFCVVAMGALASSAEASVTYQKRCYVDENIDPTPRANNYDNVRVQSGEFVCGVSPGPREPRQVRPLSPVIGQ